MVLTQARQILIKWSSGRLLSIRDGESNSIDEAIQALAIYAIELEKLIKEHTKDYDAHNYSRPISAGSERVAPPL